MGLHTAQDDGDQAGAREIQTLENEFRRLLGRNVIRLFER